MAVQFTAVPATGAYSSMHLDFTPLEDSMQALFPHRELSKNIGDLGPYGMNRPSSPGLGHQSQAPSCMHVLSRY